MPADVHQLPGTWWATHDDDSHALVGSCAQVVGTAMISAAAQIGGVLEPVGALAGDRRG